VIGPLNKKLVIELAENTDLMVPVLALNYVEGLVKENLYQFALSPIDEVQQVVKHAWSEGYRNAIILAPETAEGKRISHYFQNAWQAAEGNILAVQTFKAGEKDFSLPVRQLLNVHESKSRFQKLKNVIGYVEYNPRRRRDVDVIFIVANNSVARLINPQFYHNRAESVAVYGLSRIYSGRPRPKKDIDLENVSFCSIPWLFDQAYHSDLDKQALHEVWQSSSDNILNLIAFGIDAYTLLPYLNDLSSIPYSGATGDLVLNEYNRIERHLVCAKFNNGEAVLYDATQDEGMPEEQGYTARSIPEW
jgi:outer membrane PBP1 activator LpoA protein